MSLLQYSVAINFVFRFMDGGEEISNEFYRFNCQSRVSAECRELENETYNLFIHNLEGGKQLFDKITKQELWKKAYRLNLSKAQELLSDERDV